MGEREGMERKERIQGLPRYYRSTVGHCMPAEETLEVTIDEKLLGITAQACIRGSCPCGGPARISGTNPRFWLE